MEFLSNSIGRKTNYILDVPRLDCGVLLAVERNDVDDEYSKYWDNGLAMSYICFLVDFSLLFCLGWWIISLITPTRQTSNRVGSLSG